MKALKHEEPKFPQEDSNWLSKRSHTERSDEKGSANCLIQKSVGLKKELSEYTRSDIPQICEEITEKYSDLLGPLPLKLPLIHEVSHKIPLIDESKQLKHRLPKCPEVFRSELVWKMEAIHHHRVVGTSSSEASNAYTVYTKEKQYITYRIWSATAELKYMERCNIFPRSRHNTSWYSVS